jgi:hypothetical protein
MVTPGEQKRLGFEGFEPFDAHSQSYWVKQGETFLRLIREGVQASGDKQGAAVAQDCGVASPSQFSEALNGKNGRHFSALWIPRAIYADAQNRALVFLAAVKSQRLVPDRPFSDREIASMLIEALLANPDVGRAILAKAFGPKAENVVRATLGEDAP